MVTRSGFRLIGAFDRTELSGVAATIWAVQLVFGPVRLRYFRFGPVEWVWRSLIYGHAQPFWVVWRG